MATEDTDYRYPAGTALGMMIVCSTAFGAVQVGRDMLAAGPRPLTVGILCASLAGLTLGLAMWTGLIGHPPRRTRPIDR